MFHRRGTPQLQIGISFFFFFLTACKGWGKGAGTNTFYFTHLMFLFFFAELVIVKDGGQASLGRWASRDRQHPLQRGPLHLQSQAQRISFTPTPSHTSNFVCQKAPCLLLFSSAFSCSLSPCKYTILTPFASFVWILFSPLVRIPSKSCS